MRNREARYRRRKQETAGSAPAGIKNATGPGKTGIHKDSGFGAGSGRAVNEEGASGAVVREEAGTDDRRNNASGLLFLRRRRDCSGEGHQSEEAEQDFWSRHTRGSGLSKEVEALPEDGTHKQDTISPQDSEDIQPPRLSRQPRRRRMSPRLLIIIILFAVFIGLSFGPVMRNIEAHYRLRQKETELEEQKRISTGLIEEVEAAQSIQHVEEEARKQNMVKPGEILVLISPENELSRTVYRVRNLQSMEEAWERIRRMLNCGQAAVLMRGTTGWEQPAD